MKIVSGAQTGVDRAALDAAMAMKVEAGGWCPEGRKAEDGVIPGQYPVIELPNSDYRQRTKQNVLDSDGTVIIYFDSPSGGTELTILFCIQEHKNYILIDACELEIERACFKILDFIKRHSIKVLNVAGPRASGEPAAYEYARQLITEVLKKTA